MEQTEKSTCSFWGLKEKKVDCYDQATQKLIKAIEQKRENGCSFLKS
jgi:hypothetical protein